MSKLSSSIKTFAVLTLVAGSFATAAAHAGPRGIYDGPNRPSAQGGVGEYKSTRPSTNRTNRGTRGKPGAAGNCVTVNGIKSCGNRPNFPNR